MHGARSACTNVMALGTCRAGAVGRWRAGGSAAGAVLALWDVWTLFRAEWVNQTFQLCSVFLRLRIAGSSAPLPRI